MFSLHSNTKQRFHSGFSTYIVVQHVNPVSNQGFLWKVMSRPSELVKK